MSSAFANLQARVRAGRHLSRRAIIDFLTMQLAKVM
jgi:hypothetical protein